MSLVAGSDSHFFPLPLEIGRGRSDSRSRHLPSNGRSRDHTVWVSHGNAVLISLRQELANERTGQYIEWDNSGSDRVRFQLVVTHGKSLQPFFILFLSPFVFSSPCSTHPVVLSLLFCSGPFVRTEMVKDFVLRVVCS